MLTIADIVTTYGGIVAVRNVNIKIPEGEIIGLIGSNGAGKTTLLNTVSGFLKPQHGNIVFQESSIVGLPPHSISRLGILHVPEGRQVLGPLTVRENLILGRLASSGRAGLVDEDLNSVYRLFPVLKERFKQTAGSLSGGEQQMLAIGRALMGHPSVLLLDEPSLGLAPIVVKQMFETFVYLNKEGLTIFLIEQNSRRALEVSNYTYVMERGRIVFEGASSDLQGDPQIIAHYLGGENKKMPNKG